MRRFTLGSGKDRKIVVIEVDGVRMTVVKIAPDGSTKRSERDFLSEAKTRAASDQTASELISRGYAEAGARAPERAKTAEVAVKARKLEEAAPGGAYDDLEVLAVAAPPVLQRLAAAPSAQSSTRDAPKKRKKRVAKRKRKRRRRQTATHSTSESWPASGPSD